MSTAEQSKNSGPSQESPYPPQPQIAPYPHQPFPPPPPGTFPPYYYIPPPEGESNGAPQYMMTIPPPYHGMYAYPPPPPGQGAYPPGASPPTVRPKRKQVKMACTSCAQACKRCDESRPCERCKKYGIADSCVDGQRKERKKGVKRGPYKRKNKSDEAGFTPMNPDHSGSEYASPSSVPVPMPFPPPEGYFHPPPYYYPPPPGFAPPPHHEGAENGSPNGHPQPPMVPYYYPMYYPPPPGHPHAPPAQPQTMDPAEATKKATNVREVEAVDDDKDNAKDQDKEANDKEREKLKDGKKRLRAGKSGAEPKVKKVKAAVVAAPATTTTTAKVVKPNLVLPPIVALELPGPGIRVQASEEEPDDSDEEPVVRSA